MRNLKKVLALVVAVAMIASMGFVASAANFSDVASNASYADAVNLLSNLGIIKGYEDGTFRPDNTVTRAEAATMIVRMLDLVDGVEAGDTIFTDVKADDWCSGYVNVAVANGIVNGMGDGLFLPDGEVTYGQIVKMIVCALGYEPVAEANGGWNGGGYLYAGSVAGFTKGVSGTVNAAASRATVAKLIYNALEVNLMEQDSFSTGINGSSFKVSEDKTILSEYLGLEKVEGVITSTYLSDKTAYDVEAEKTVELVITKNYAEDKDYEGDFAAGETVELVATAEEAATLLGYSVVAYVGENEDEAPAVFAVAEKAGKNTKLVLDAELIVSIDEKVKNDEAVDNTWEIVYYKNESAKSTTTAEIQAYVGKDNSEAVANEVVNGFVADAGSIIDNVAELEEVELLDNDGDGDFEFLFAIAPVEGSTLEFVVAEIEAEDGVYAFVGENDEDFEINTEDETKLYTVIKDGEIVDADAIVAGDVVTVLDNDDETVIITVYVSSKVVEGTVDEVEGEVYTVAGSELELSSLSFDLVDDEDGVDTLDAGEEGKFYVNAFGKIAYVDTVKSIATSDYVYVIAAEVDDSAAFTDAEYLVKVVTAEGNVEVLTIKSKKVDVYTADGENEDLKDSEAFAFLEEYVGIARIETATTGEIDTIYFPDYDVDFVSEDRFAADADAEEPKAYNEARKTYGSVDLALETLVFNISDDEDEDLEDRVTVTTVGNLFVDGSSYSFTAYGEEEEAADVLVVTAGAASADAEAPVMVVTKVSTVTADDEETIKIKGLVAGEEVEVIVDPDEDVEVEVGNVILYAANAAYVEEVQVLFASTEDAPAEGVTVGGDVVADLVDDAVSVHYGEIEEKTTKTVMLEGVVDEEGETVKFYFADEVNVTVVDYTGRTVSITDGSISSVKKSFGDYTRTAFVKTALDATDEITDVVVFVTSAE